MQRRRATWHTDNNDDSAIPKAVRLWRQAVHVPGIYDVEVDTSVLSSEECAALIHRRQADGCDHRLFSILRPSRSGGHGQGYDVPPLVRRDWVKCFLSVTLLLPLLSAFSSVVADHAMHVNSVGWYRPMS